MKESVSGRFLRMQRRMLVTTIIGYTLFYFLRKNLSLAMPGLAQDYGITKSSLGLFLTLHGVVYGLGKFVVGPMTASQKMFNDRMYGKSVRATTSAFMRCPPGKTWDMPG